MSVPGSVAMQRPTGEVPQMGPAASRGPLVKWPPNLKSPNIIRISMMVLPRISLPKMRRLSKIGVLATILGAFLFLPGGSAHLGTIDTLSMSFTGPCIYDGSYGKANLILIIIRAGKSASSWHRRWEPSKGPVSRSRAVYAKLESNSEPERARVCQRVAVRASESQSGSHREP